jgi:hypothetical protein
MGHGDTQRGYILIYALAVLLFLVGTVTGAAYGLRVDAQEITQRREQLRAEFRLRGGLQYALAQFELGRAAAAAAGTGQEQPRRGWRAEASKYQVQIDAEDVAVTIEDPGGIADLNALDERMWTDYLAAAAAIQPEQARRWAAAVMAWKARLGKANGRGAFASVEDLLALDVLPVAVRYGGRAAAVDPSGPAGDAPGLTDLFVVNGSDRAMDVNRAALPLVAAFTGAGAEALAAYEAARRQRKLTAADATRLLGSRATQIMQESRPDAVIRVVLTTVAGPARLALTALVRRQDNVLRVIGTRFDPMAAAASAEQ